MDSDDQNARINQHNRQGGLSFDVAAAKGGSSTNPLLSAPSGGGGGGGGNTNCVPRPSGASGTATAPSPTETDDSDDDDDHHHHGPPSGYTGWPTASPTGRPWDQEHEHDSMYRLYMVA